MKHARVIYEQRTHDAVEDDGQLRLADGRRVAFDAVDWLPPLAPLAGRPRTILALGLNYADHAKELAFKPPSEPLAFLKGESALIGHRQFTRRPAGVSFPPPSRPAGRPSVTERVARSTAPRSAVAA